MGIFELHFDFCWRILKLYQTRVRLCSPLISTESWIPTFAQGFQSKSWDVFLMLSFCCGHEKHRSNDSLPGRIHWISSNFWILSFFLRIWNFVQSSFFPKGIIDTRTLFITDNQLTMSGSQCSVLPAKGSDYLSRFCQHIVTQSSESSLWSLEWHQIPL